MNRKPALLLAALGMGACGTSSAPSEDKAACVGSKCDSPTDVPDEDEGTDATGSPDPFAGLPNGSDSEFCEQRHRDVYNANQLAFTPTALRWSCNDVDGVSDEWRGQEYCEYFAMVDLPGDASSPGGVDILGRPLGPSGKDGTTPLGLTLSPQQLSAWEKDPSAVVGQCIFTSWNSDAPDPITCSSDDDSCDRPQVMGVDVDETFRMMFTNNSAEAALDLADECINTATDVADEDNPQDPLHDDFTRGCLHTGALHETAWRKSDTIMCSALVRASECDCYPELEPIFDPEAAAETEGSVWTFPGFPEALGDTSKRGFTLGTWSSVDKLPTGCQHIVLPDGSPSLVRCELSAAEVLNAASDVKDLCRQKYADNVVVHVPLSTDWVTCNPNDSSQCYDPPWALQPAQ